jgi:hypothetical protein
LECVAALAVLATAATLVAQLGAWHLTARARTQERQAAQEFAANILEGARAISWNDLNPDWASSQRLPPPFEKRDWQLRVEVTPEAGQPLIKRVTVQIHRAADEATKTRLAELTGLFCARSNRAPGGKR